MAAPFQASHEDVEILGSSVPPPQLWRAGAGMHGAQRSQFLRRSSEPEQGRSWELLQVGLRAFLFQHLAGSLPSLTRRLVAAARKAE